MTITNPISPISEISSKKIMVLTSMLSSLLASQSIPNIMWTASIINATRYIGINAKMDGLTSFSISSSPVKRNFSLSESLFETASAGASVSVLTAVSSVVSDVTSSSDIFTSPNYYPYLDGHEPCGDFINEVVPMSVLHYLGYFPNPRGFSPLVHHQFRVL